MLLHWVQICQRLVFPSPRWVRSQWHNQLGSTKKRKRKHGTKNNTKEKGKETNWWKKKWEGLTGWCRVRDHLHTYLSSLLLYIFCVCPWKWKGQEDSFCVTALLPYSLDSVYVTRSALYIIYSHTHKSLWLMSLALLPLPCPPASSCNLQITVILCGHMFDLGMPWPRSYLEFYILDVK